MADAATKIYKPISKNEPKFTVVYCLAQRKLNESSFKDFLELCSKDSRLITKGLHLDEPQTIGNGDIFIHHNPEMFVQNRYGENVKNFIKNQTNILVMDPIKSVEKLLCRIYTIQTLANAFKGTIFQVPETIDVSHLSSLSIAEKQEALVVIMKRGRLQYPILAKRLWSKDHQMVLVCGDDGLLTLAAFIEQPSLLQQFKPHSHVMYKIKMYGEHQYQLETRNTLSTSSQTSQFCSTGVSRQKLLHSGRETDQKICSNCEITPADFPLNKETVHILASLISKGLGLELICIDFIVATQGRDKGKIFVIDVNYFPPIRCQCGVNTCKGQGGTFLYDHIWRALLKNDRQIDC